MKKRWLIAIIVAYIVVRIYIATLSSYGFYHGWNEGYYSLIAKNYFSGSLWEQIAYTGGGPFSSAPPFFSYAVFAFFKVFGIADISARLVSILSEIIAVFGVYILAKELYNERTADLAAIIFIFIPWNILWFGRAQTDPLMTALMTLAIALYVRAYKSGKSMLPFGITLGLAVFTKQPALAVLPIVLIWSYFQGVKREQIFNAIACFFAGMIPLFIWLSHSAISGNYEVVYSIIFGELAHRSEPFSDIGRVVLFTAAGISPLIIAAAAYQILKERNVKNILAIWLLIYGTFVLVRTPPSHEYYSLPLMAPLAIFVSAAIARCSNKVNIFVIIILISTLPFTYAVLTYSGDLGYTNTKRMGEYLQGYYKEDVFLAVHMKYTPQMEWYSNAKIYSIGDQSLREIEEMSEKQSLPAFLLIDETDLRLQSAGEKYEEVHRETYSTLMPSPQIIPKILILYRIK
jgi:4-amino-4-deoxy-L-arabinose transferase-like glycosyltransferase